MNLRLIEYSQISEKQYTNYIEEWEQSGEKIVPAASRRNNNSFNDLIETWNENETDVMYAKDFAQSTLYFMIDSDGRIYGAIHLRHELNNGLLQRGGHIGYGIRPCERRKGYASTMLGLLLKLIKPKSYERVLATCDDDNIASIKTIERNNGILQDKVMVKGSLIRRYWIQL